MSAAAASSNLKSAVAYPGVSYCDAGRGIRLAYESFGPVSFTLPPILMVMGLSSQMLAWPTGMCQLLSTRTGLRVVRFDNRDVGLSTHLDGVKVNVMKALQTKDFSCAPYRLADMADDAAALIRHLAVESGLASPRAHVIGASMGGMIVQELAMHHPHLLASVASVMSTPDFNIGRATEEAMGVLLAPPPTDRESAIERGLEVFRVIGSPKYPLDATATRALVGDAFDRSFDPAGGARQLMAIWASPSRTQALGDKVPSDLPFLVIHGKVDPLITLEGGQATVEALNKDGRRGSDAVELVVLEEMGHNFPPELWPEFVTHIQRFVQQANQKLGINSSSCSSSNSDTTTSRSPERNAKL